MEDRMKEDILKEEFKKLNIELEEKQVFQFIKYYEMLIEKNKVMNLTAITEFKDVLVKHFIDSILVLKCKEFHQYISEMQNNTNTNFSVIDVGTGAGFPGIPLKILFPQIEITLLDSLNKRVNFLNEVVETLQLKNIKCIHGRAEDFGHNIDYREKYDMCVSRAVANLSTLSEYCVPFIKKNGLFISYKATGVDVEINNAKNAMKLLGCKIEKNNNINMKDLDGIVYERNFVFIRKYKQMDKKYPRKSGMPSKNPL